MYGVDKLHASYGWLLFAQGMAFLVLFPVTNWLDSASPTSSLTFNCCCMATSAFFIALIYKPFFNARKFRIKLKQ